MCINKKNKTKKWISNRQTNKNPRERLSAETAKQQQTNKQSIVVDFCEK